MAERSRAAVPGTALRRSVGTLAATATSIGLAFAAIDYLGVISVVTYAPGASAWLAIVIGGLFALLVAGDVLGTQRPLSDGRRHSALRGACDREPRCAQRDLHLYEHGGLGDRRRCVSHRGRHSACAERAGRTGLSLDRLAARSGGGGQPHGCAAGRLGADLRHLHGPGRDGGAFGGGLAAERRAAALAVRPLRRGKLQRYPGDRVRALSLRRVRVGDDHRGGGSPARGHHPRPVHRPGRHLHRRRFVCSCGYAPNPVRPAARERISAVAARRGGAGNRGRVVDAGPHGAHRPQHVQRGFSRRFTLHLRRGPGRESPATVCDAEWARGALARRDHPGCGLGRRSRAGLRHRPVATAGGGGGGHRGGHLCRRVGEPLHPAAQGDGGASLPADRRSPPGRLRDRSVQRTFSGDRLF